MPQLKLGKLPDRVAVKLTISLSPELKQTLEAYAMAYAEAYGRDEPLVDLIPPMLANFVASDRSFLRSRKR